MTREGLALSTTERSEQEAELLELLQSFNHVRLSEWGTGDAKDFDSFVDEITGEERFLYKLTDISANDKIPKEINRKENDQVLVGEVHRVYVHVTYLTPDGELLELVEGPQVYKADGRKAKRERVHVREKMKPEERTDKMGASLAAVRAMREESGGVLNIPLSRFPEAQSASRRVRELSMSTNYPGMVTDATKYYFELKLNDNEFKQSMKLDTLKEKHFPGFYGKAPMGFVENQERKTNYLYWRKIPNGGKKK